MFGFKPTPAAIIKKDQAKLKREADQYKRELVRVGNELNILRKSLDLHTKKGNMVLAREVASKIVNAERRQNSLNSAISDLQRAEDQVKDLQMLATRATTQRSINSMRSSVLATIDAKEVYKIQHEAERQKDQIEMTEESLKELFEQDEETIEQTDSRIEELLAVSLEKSVLENTIPDVSTHVPSISSSQQLKTAHPEEYLVSASIQPKLNDPRTPPSQPSSSIPSMLPKPDPSSSLSPSLSSNSSSNFLRELELEERLRNLSK